MKLVVVSPASEDPREAAVLVELFAAGLERYHVRKPAASADDLERWLRLLPANGRRRIVLHQHHELVETLGLGGRHWRDDANAPLEPARAATNAGSLDALKRGTFTSRSCHDLTTLRAALGHYDSVFIGPVFPSISKPGHGQQNRLPADELAALLAGRSVTERRTSVIALGGITAETALRAHALGFDGVAVLGALWQSADPVHAFMELRAVTNAASQGRSAPPTSPAHARGNATAAKRPSASASTASSFRSHAA